MSARCTRPTLPLPRRRTRNHRRPPRRRGSPRKLGATRMMFVWLAMTTGGCPDDVTGPACSGRTGVKSHRLSTEPETEQGRHPKVDHLPRTPDRVVRRLPTSVVEPHSWTLSTATSSPSTNTCVTCRSPCVNTCVQGRSAGSGIPAVARDQVGGKDAICAEPVAVDVKVRYDLVAAPTVAHSSGAPPGALAPDFLPGGKLRSCRGLQSPRPGRGRGAACRAGPAHRVRRPRRGRRGRYSRGSRAPVLPGDAVLRMHATTICRWAAVLGPRLHDRTATPADAPPDPRRSEAAGPTFLA